MMEPQPMLISCLEEPRTNGGALPRHSSSLPALVSTDFGAGSHWGARPSFFRLGFHRRVFVGFSREICIKEASPLHQSLAFGSFPSHRFLYDFDLLCPVVLGFPYF